MAIIDELLEQPAPPQVQDNWLKDRIKQLSSPQTERLKRTPVGFNFQRDPFDPSSYYNQIGTLRDISRTATEDAIIRSNNAANRAAAQNVNLGSALGGVAANFTYSGKSKKYGLGGVSSHVAKMADTIGGMFGIKTIGGYRSKGSVPGSDHPKGRALDYMINNIKNGKRVGTDLANYMVKNARTYNVKYVIWNRRIWSPGRGWRRYSGPSPHTDHVHVSFNK